MCRSTCFWRLRVHHQELTTALTASSFTLECGGISVVGCGPAGQREKVWGARYTLGARYLSKNTVNSFSHKLGFPF
jgi:hypothetical protein